MKAITYQDQLLLNNGVTPRGVRPGELVPLAITTIRTTTQEELQDPHSLERLYIARGRLQRTLHSVFPVEEQVKTATSKALELVTRDISRLELTPVFNLPTIDPSFLSWKNPWGYPGFSIYSLNDPTCSLEFRFDWNGGGLTHGMKPKIPEIMAKHYLDRRLMATMRAECQAERLNTVILKAKYAGAMPEKTRERIRFYTDEDTGAPCFEEIFIIAEAPEWSRDVVREIRIGDPIVVGLAHKLLWVIDTYDLTKAEAAALALCRGTDAVTRADLHVHN